MAIVKNPARFKVVCAGRRFGKSLLSVVVALRTALRGGRVWVVAPSYKQTLENWTYLQRLVVQMPVNVAKTHVTELLVTFSGGGSIQMRTGDNPDNLRGAGLDGIVLDEAATMKQDAWDLVLRPALADRQGWALFIGTPQHYNWFYDLYTHAESDADWAAWQHPTWDNPYIAESEIEAARRDMTEEDFDQEFGASFTAVGGAVFKDLAANRPFFLRPMPSHLATEFRRTGIGKDWGTTDAHNAAVVCESILPSGVVWFRSSWLDISGSANDWYDEDARCRRDYHASFARVDRSQSSAIDHLRAMGFEADKGIADVEARIGDLIGLVKRKAVFFDSNNAGVRVLFNHLCAYHRDKDGKIVEEQDDDVDAALYVNSELVRPKPAVPASVNMRREQGRTGYGLGVKKAKV